ncbi:hypothetical protein [Halosegnis marinus]|uniref:hypothetical protein n=1 Tax=Halosegnis marinus TaxID=3034023 RepID=UPI0036094DC0
MDTQPGEPAAVAVDDVDGVVAGGAAGDDDVLDRDGRRFSSKRSAGLFASRPVTSSASTRISVSRTVTSRAPVETVSAPSLTGTFSISIVAFSTRTPLPSRSRMPRVFSRTSSS